MKLNFTGIGAAYYPVFGSNCAFFEHQNHLYMLDCGESTFQKMFVRDEIYQYDHITVFLTHLHADHIGSLGSFLSFCPNVLHKKILLVAEDDTIVNILKLSGVGPELYNFTTDFASCGTETFQITPQREIHASDMICCGFVIECDGQTLYFSGDAASIPENILRDFLAGKIHTMYQECTFADKDSPSHCSLEKLKRWIPEKERTRVYCMHLGDDFRKEVLEAGFQIPEVV